VDGVIAREGSRAPGIARAHQGRMLQR
jgi:hypothetical protein